MTSKMKELLIKTKRRLFGQNIGNNTSIFQGNGLDFAELKEYIYGDDVRKINWKVTARTQTPYVNVFYEERELNVVIASLMSGSIYFGSVRQKQEVMAEIMALLGLSAISHSDRVTTIFYDEHLMRRFKPSKNPNTIYTALEYALSVDVLGKRGDLQGLADFLLHAIPQRSIILLLGDFYERADLSLLATKHECYAIMVRDRFEENPTLEGEYGFIDPITLSGETLELDFKMVAKFRADLQKDDERWLEHFRKHRIASTKIYTDEDPLLKLRELLK